MNYIKYIFGLLVALIGIVGRLLFWRSGRDKERLKNAENTIEAIKKGNTAAANKSYDDSLRKKYGID